VESDGFEKEERGKRLTSEKCRAYDGYILVSPEYNHGMPGGVKNAIDFLYNEWIGKPALIVTYGIFGGLKSSEQLAGVSFFLPLPFPIPCPTFPLPSRVLH
jgi:NAD(P)H-dependent FMN reductase